MIRVELFGIARARAGRADVLLRAGTVREAMAALEEACPGLRPEVVCNGALTEHFLLCREGGKILKDPSAPLAGGDVLLLMGAHAGG